MIGGPPEPAVTPSARSTTSGAGSFNALVHSEIGVDHPGVVAQAGEWPLRDDLAEIHHNHPIAGLLDEREVVLDHDHGAALAGELPHGLADPRTQHGINAPHRLVEDDQAGLGGPGTAGLGEPFYGAR